MARKQSAQLQRSAPASQGGLAFLGAGLVATGLAMRLVLALGTYGTNDAWTWTRFATGIERDGLMAMYAADSQLNHPPIPAYWSVAALKISRLLAGEGSDLAFAFTFKLPMLLADCAAAYLIWRLWKERGRFAGAWLAAALFAWSLVAILISAYHFNTDSLYAFLCLLAVYLIDRRGLHLPGGLALAAAINVKLIPVLLIPPLLLSCKNRREAGGFLAGLAVGVIPYLPPLIIAGSSFYHNALAYVSNVERWGMILCLPHAWIEPYQNLGRWLIIAFVLALAMVNWKTRRWGRYELCALSFAGFLVLTPGFGVQYTVILVPLLFAVDVGFAAVYSTLAGAFLLMLYWHFGVATELAASWFDGPFPAHATIAGILTWSALLGWTGWRILRPAHRRDNLPAAATSAACR